MNRKLILFLFLSLAVKYSSAQDLSQLVDSIAPKKKSEPVIATFKGTQLVNFQTLETDSKRTLEFLIQHRFGYLSSGAYNFYGIDGPANIRLALSYSFDGRFEFGIGRTNDQKMYDGHLKYRLLRQTTDNHIPFSITLFTEGGLVTMKDPNAATGVDMYHYYSDRFNYVYQVMIGRKFSPSLSLQIAPTMIHYNIVPLLTDKNDIYSIVGLGRMKFTKRMAVTVEYSLGINRYSQDMTQYHNSFGAGIDIETGGHVFQIIITNSYGIDASQVIPYTNGNVLKGDLEIGFNISRVFSL